MPQGIPRQIGRYKVEAEIGRGGFGRVYRALDAAVGRPVAIKVLTESSKELLTRFRNEAAVAGNLKHQNIVTLYEFGEYDGKPFLAMEYLEGETLQDIMSSGKPLTLLEKCNIMSQAAEGLYCAHRSGVIHRDVKPANIMVLPDGTVKIMDFGIAKLVSGSSATRLTQEGFVIGTLLYMSPEQLKGLSEVDALCDIFAYGVIYYELVAGKHPFAAADSHAVMYNLAYAEPAPIRDLVPDFPDTLQSVISRMLAKDRDLRYSNLKQVQFDIDPIRIELQQQQASDLLLQAQALIARQQLEPAQNLILEVLTLDPSNRVARSLWEALQKQSQQRVLQPRIESLLRTAEEQMSQRKFAEAVRSFESALRLDTGNKYIQDRLEHSRALLEHSKKVAALLAEARQQFAEQNLTGASRTVSEALRHDPEHPEAVDLLRAIHDAAERRQREQRVEEAIHKAEGLMLRNSHDQAIAVLEQLGKDAQTSKVKLFLSVVQTSKREEERKHKLRAGMASASDLLRDHQLNGAVQHLTSLRDEFPDDNEVANLLSYAKSEQEAEAKNRRIDEAAGRARQLVLAHDFDGALAVLDDTLKAFPGHSRLVGMVGKVLSAKTIWEHDQAVMKVTQYAGALRSEQRLAESIKAVETALREFPAEPALLEMLEQLRPELEVQRRGQAVKRVIDGAAQLLQQGQPDKAVPVLQQGLLQYPNEPALIELLNRAEREHSALQKSQALEAIQRRVDTHSKANNFTAALAAINEGLVAWPDESRLIQQRDKFLALQQERDRQQGIQIAIAQAKKDQSAEQFAGAAELIDRARKSYGDDAALVALADENTRMWAAHERNEDVRAIAAKGRECISGGRLEEALAQLREGLRRYPGEPSLTAAAAEAQQALDARERKAEVDRIVAQSRECVADREFDRAAHLLDEGLASYPGEAELNRGLDHVRVVRKAWERETAVRQAVDDATRLAAGARFPEALGTLGKALELFRNDPSLLDAKREIEASHTRHQRREAVAKAASDATAMLDQGRLDDALQLIRGASKKYPGESEWPPLLRRAEQGLEARAQAEERDKYIRKVELETAELARNRKFEAALDAVAQARLKYPAEASLTAMEERLKAAWEQDKHAAAVAREAARVSKSIEQGKLDDAVQSLQGLHSKYPGEAVFDTLLASAKSQIDARQLRDETSQKAGRLIAQQDFEQAVTFLDHALAKLPGDPALLSLRDQALAQLNEIRQRQDGIRLALEACRSLARQKRFEDALQQMDAALEQYGGEPELIALRGELQLGKGLADARLALNQSRPGDALRTIEGIAAEHRARPDVATVRKQAEEQLAAQEQAAAIEKHAQAAREKASAGDLDGAINLLDAGLRQWPGAESLATLRDRVIAARAARQRQQTIDDTAIQCRALRQQNRLDSALLLIQKMLEQFENEPALVTLRKQIEADLLEREKRQRRDGALGELAAIASSLARVASFSEVARLTAAVRGIQSQFPGDEAVGIAASGPLGVLSSIESARRALDTGDVDTVQSICQTHLVEYPGHVLFSQLRAEGELRRKRAFIDALQKRSAAEPDLNRRAAVLEEALTRYPDEEWIVAELRLTRNRISLLQAALDKARAAEAAGQWDEALEQWGRVGTIHGSYPNLKSEIDRVTRARDSARTEQIAARVRTIETQIKAGDLAGAGESVRRSQAEMPGVPVLVELGRQVDEIVRKRNRARDLVTQARKALEADWRRASDLLAEAAALQSVFPMPDDLTRAVAAKKRDAAVAEALTEVERIRKSGDLRAAAAAVDKAIAAQGEDSRLTGLRTALTAELRRRQEAIREELRRIGESAGTATDRNALRNLLERASAIAAEHRTDPEIGPPAEAAVQSVQARIKQVRREGLLSAVASQRKTVGAGAAIVALAVAAWYGYKAIPSSSGSTVLSIQAARGVLIHVGDRECTTPDCSPILKPGSYALKASKGGYQTVETTVTIAPGQKQVDIPLELLPLPELVQINTNFEKGTVYIDGRTAGELSSGQFSVSGVAAGRHTIRVTGADGEFQTEWRSQAGVRPELSGPIRARNLVTTVVANAGSDAAIACNCGSENVTVDGKQAGQTGQTPGKLTPLASLAEGMRQIGVAGHSMVLDVRPHPTLSVFLSLDRNVGTVVVETGQGAAKIYLNNRFYRQTAGTGNLRMPLDVGSYSIRVEKDGFRPTPAQTIEVKKGEEKKVTVALTALPAVLEIAGAQPGAQVTIDQTVAGHVGANGMFRAEGLAVGRHLIELTSEGFSPARIQEDVAGGRTTRIDGTRVAMAKINRPPPPPVPPSPSELEAQDWEKVRTKGAEDLDNFVKKYPGGAHAEEARTRAAGIRQQAQRGAEESAWAAVDKNKKAALDEFLSAHGNNPHAAEARAILTRLEKQEADAALAVQRARERAEQEQQARAAAQQQEAIKRALSAYETAYNQMDLRGLRAVWSTIPDTTARIIGKQFQDAKSVTMQLRPSAPPVITGETAVVVCDRSLSFTPKDSRRASESNDRVRVTLALSGAGWTIRAIAAN